MDIEEIESTDFLNDDLVCTICYAEFLDKEDLELHVNQLHLNEARKNRFCKLCTIIFPDIEHYALHLRNHHIRSLKCCKYCFRLFKTTIELQEHEKKHNISVLYPKISCSHCKHVFDNKNEVRNHELKEHMESDNGFMLKDCLPILSSVLSMNINDFLAASYCNLPYKCVVCNIMTMDINIYIQHLFDNNCQGHACDECCNVYAFKSKLTNHMHGHFYEDNECKLELAEKQCPKCKQPFDTAIFKTHIKTCAGISCAMCDLTFNSVNEYTSHRIAEHKSCKLSLEVCIYCQRPMVGVDAMEKHVERAHKNEKHLYKYHCTDCNRLFKHPKLLFAHFYSKHKDLHPYTCKICCNQKFRLRKNFTLHIKLTHKSVGFVEFDENFHVFFTDKKSDKQSNSQKVLEKSVDENNDGNESNDENNDEHCKDSDSLCGDKIEIETINNKCNESKISEQPRRKICAVAVKVKPEGSKAVKANEKFRIVEVNVKNHTGNIENENLNNEDTGDVSDVLENPLEYPVKKQVLKRKRNVTKKGKFEHANDDNDVLSDDSDTPLKLICEKKTLQTKKRKICKMPLNKSSKTKKFICNKCNRNCYTYQNYHRHKALHNKKRTKTCIKCYDKFESVKKLNEHIKNEHSTSKLTETLKKLLEKRKIADARPEENPNSKEILDEDITLSTAEKFRNTIKKVKIDRNPTKVTMKLVDKDKISVKKYLENFTPDNFEVKITMLKNTAALDNTTVRRLRQFIKLTKFTPEPTNQMEEVSLKMPVKFTDDLREKCQVSIKLVTDYAAPTMKFGSRIENVKDENYINAYDECYSYDSFESEHEFESKDVIPEIAQEVMLVGTEEPNSVVHTVNLKNLPACHDVKIAHLAPEAPYFKITKVSTLEPEKDAVIAPPDNITLPNGKKFVSVNPFAHLLDKKAIDELKNSKKKKNGYKPRLTNVAEAITKAMEILDKTPHRERKKC